MFWYQSLNGNVIFHYQHNNEIEPAYICIQLKKEEDFPNSSISIWSYVLNHCDSRFVFVHDSVFTNVLKMHGCTYTLTFILGALFIYVTGLKPRTLGHCYGKWLISPQISREIFRSVIWQTHHGIVFIMSNAIMITRQHSQPATDNCIFWYQGHLLLTRINKRFSQMRVP